MKSIKPLPLVVFFGVSLAMLYYAVNRVSLAVNLGFPAYLLHKAGISVILGMSLAVPLKLFLFRRGGVVMVGITVLVVFLFSLFKLR